MHPACQGLLLALPQVLLPAEADSTGRSSIGQTAAAASHARMLETLEKVAAETPRRNAYVGDASAQRWRNRLKALTPPAGVRRAGFSLGTTDPVDPADEADPDRRRTPAATTVQEPSPRARWTALRKVAYHELRLGNNQASIDAHQAACELIDEVGDEFPHTTAIAARVDLAVAHLRLGEQQNCVARHTSESCILPIGPSGVHEDQAGARAAIEILEKVLGDEPEDLRARWLLNVGYMTVGEYPDGVPEAWLIPESTFESDETFPRFVDAASEFGLDNQSLCGGAIIDDFNGDGFLDLVVADWDPTGQLRMFNGSASGRYSEVTGRAGLTGISGGLNMMQADYDNDGLLDLLVLRGAWLGDRGNHPNSLLKNMGDGRFLDVAYAAGLAEKNYPTQTAGWADYDNDGDLDLYVGNEWVPGVSAPCQLFQNNGDGTFVDVAEAAGVRNERFAKGVTWGDFDGDRFPDLYVSNQGGLNRLYRNRGDGTFVDQARRFGVTHPIESFPTWFWDFDNDGELDLLVATYQADLRPSVASYLGIGQEAEPMRLYRGDGGESFASVGERMGLGKVCPTMGSNFGDLDNDGFLDFYLGTGYPGFDGLVPNLMYWNRGGARFADVTTAGGFGHLQKGHAVVFADLDRDGDQDVFEQIGGAYKGDSFPDALFENPGFGNHWIDVRLVGKKSNVSAIGARIRCDLTEDGNQRSVYRYVNSGGSFGANPLSQSIGLGQAEKVDRLEVYWPTSDTTQVFQDLEVDRRFTIVEGAESPTERP